MQENDFILLIQNTFLMLFVGGGGYVGEGEHFPALRSKAGEAEPVARRAIVHHIHRRRVSVDLNL